jgi:hypothetical protein
MTLLAKRYLNETSRWSLVVPERAKPQVTPSAARVPARSQTPPFWSQAWMKTVERGTAGVIPDLNLHGRVFLRSS